MICCVCRQPKGLSNGNHLRCEKILLDVLFPGHDQNRDERLITQMAAVDNSEVW